MKNKQDISGAPVIIPGQHSCTVRSLISIVKLFLHRLVVFFYKAVCIKRRSLLKEQERTPHTQNISGFAWPMNYPNRLLAVRLILDKMIRVKK